MVGKTFNKSLAICPKFSPITLYGNNLQHIVNLLCYCDLRCGLLSSHVLLTHATEVVMFEGNKAQDGDACKTK